MRVLPRGLGKAQPSMILLLLLVIAIAAQVAAVPADDTSTETTDAARTTDDPSTTDSTKTTAATTTETSSSSTSTSTSDKTTSTTSSSSTRTTMDTTTTSSSETSTTSDTSTSTSSVSTTTTSSTSSSSSTTAAAISAAPEGTVFIAVGAALGLIGLTLLAWRAMIAWSVNRSVRRAAIIHASESKRLLRGSRKKRSTPYTAAPAADVSLDKLGAATRASYKPNRIPSSNSGLFFSPTAGGGPHGSHASLNATGNTGNRGSTYLPAGYYAAAGSSTPAAGAGEVPYSPAAGLSSPSLPPTGVYHDSHNQRQSYVGASTSSLNLNQAPQGRAPSAYLEDLFESHVPSHNSGSDRR
ncbi:hypothetical protein N7522_009394 [Penicillium canescens]|nr:hypothetical protein N7522_009394 [Penicillium canescens]